MNYEKIYESLCERAKNRQLKEYSERHHIIPRCLGGSNDEENIVRLTPEEHYVAHQLLVKMNPNHSGLIWAALQMTGQPNKKRTNNKLYGWLKRKQQLIAKQRIGDKNGSYGRSWYYNPDTLENIKCLPEEAPEGYVKGRKFRKNPKCKKCGKITKKISNQYCSKKCATISREQRENEQADRKYLNLVKKHTSISAVLRELNYNLRGKNYETIKRVIVRNGLQERYQHDTINWN